MCLIVNVITHFTFISEAIFCLVSGRTSGGESEMNGKEDRDKRKNESIDWKG